MKATRSSGSRTAICVLIPKPYQNGMHPSAASASVRLADGPGDYGPRIAPRRLGRPRDSGDRERVSCLDVCRRATRGVRVNPGNLDGPTVVIGVRMSAAEPGGWQIIVVPLP